MVRAQRGQTDPGQRPKGPGEQGRCGIREVDTRQVVTSQNAQSGGSFFSWLVLVPGGFLWSFNLGGAEKSWTLDRFRQAKRPRWVAPSALATGTPSTITVKPTELACQKSGCGRHVQAPREGPSRETDTTHQKG